MAVLLAPYAPEVAPFGRRAFGRFCVFKQPGAGQPGPDVDNFNYRGGR